MGAAELFQLVHMTPDLTGRHEEEEKDAHVVMKMKDFVGPIVQY